MGFPVNTTHRAATPRSSALCIRQRSTSEVGCLCAHMRQSIAHEGHFESGQCFSGRGWPRSMAGKSSGPEQRGHAAINSTRCTTHSVMKAKRQCKRKYGLGSVARQCRQACVHAPRRRALPSFRCGRIQRIARLGLLTSALTKCCQPASIISLASSKGMPETFDRPSGMAGLAFASRSVFAMLCTEWPNSFVASSCRLTALARARRTYQEVNDSPGNGLRTKSSGRCRRHSTTTLPSHA